MTATDPSRAVTVYEPTVTGMPVLGQYVNSLWERRRFIWHLARTDLKSEHYDTAIGQVWIVLDPLLMAAVYYLLRSVVRPAGSPSARSELIAHLLWAVFFFTYTSNSLTQGSRAVLGNRGLVLNSSFPRAVLPIQAITKAALDFLPTFVVYLGFHAILRQPFGVGLLALPLIFALQTMFNLGCALFFAPLMVFFRDTGGFMPYMTKIWLYVTPALFTIKEIPDNLRALFKLNPLYPYIGALEQVFHGRLPSSWYVLAAATWAVLVFVIGSVVFLARERDFAIRL